MPVLWASGCLFPSCCVKCTHQAETLTVLLAGRWVISFQGLPLRVGCIFCHRCVFAVMYSLGSEPYGAVVCVFGVIGPLPVLFFTKISCDIHFQGAQITTTFFSPQTLWETGGKGVWHHFPAHGRGCPVYRRRAAKSVERREGKAMGIVIRASWGWHELDFFPGIIVPSRSP